MTLTDNGGMTMYIIKNAILCDKKGMSSPKTLLIEEGKIKHILHAEAPFFSNQNSDTVVDAQGHVLLPGLIDVHVHFREPGYEYKETIQTGSTAAVKGGFTTVVCMPNTRPVIDHAETLKGVLNKGKEARLAKVLSYATITIGQLGQQLTDFSSLKEAGAIGFTDDGVGVQDASLMKQAMTVAASLHVPIVAHCEENSLVGDAFVTVGEFSKRYGIRGIPNESEAIHVARDILLAEATGVHYHVCHVSTAQSVRLIREAKKQGIHVTAEVCPHHLLLCDEQIPALDANWKMNPPLRSPRDVEACIEGLEDGTIDMIVTDHAPHSAEDKAKGMQHAPFGIVGLETAFPLLYTKFVITGKWTLRFLIEKMSENPASVFGIKGGTLLPGAAADFTIIDVEKKRMVDPATFATKGRNTPFTNWTLQGWPIGTWVDGRQRWSQTEQTTCSL